MWVEALKPLVWQEESLDSPSFLIPPDYHQKQKDKTLDSPGFIVSFSHTKDIYLVDTANTYD